MPALRGLRRRSALVFVFLAAAAAGFAGWDRWGRPAAHAERLLAEARSARATGDEAGAEQAAAAAAALNPALAEAALIAAEAAADRRRFEQAVSYASRVDRSDRRRYVRAKRLAARLNHRRLYRFSDAERDYLRVLEVSPDDVEANAGLATLLGLCGRAREAVPCILRLIRAGEPTDLPVMLAKESGGVDDPDSLERARAAAPEDPNLLLGLARRASSEGRSDDAIELLRRAAAVARDDPAVQAALGRELRSAGRYDSLVEWEARVPDAAAALPDTWVVRGDLAERRGDLEGATRCYLEAASRAPELKAANAALARLLAAIGEHELSDRFAGRVLRLTELGAAQDRVLFSDARGEVRSVLELVAAYERAGRVWEALAWVRLGLRAAPTDGALLTRYDDLSRRVAGLPLTLTVDEENVAKKVDRSAYRLPSPRAPDRATPSSPGGREKPLSFRDDAAEAGLRFSYFNGAADRPSRRMYEFTGGGVAVLDLDADGLPDVFFAQGRSWPAEQPARADDGDRVFRNIDGRRFADVTASVGLHENDFGQGVAAGDYDADGFADLYVANIGPNRTWRNNGDGTVSDATEETGTAGSPDEWSTSCILADFSGDGLPDLYVANYLRGAHIFERVCRGPDGGPVMCMPFDFDAQPDRFYRNDGSGQFVDEAASLSPGVSPGKGLGLAAWDDDGSGRLSLYVANDTTPGLFFSNRSDGGRARLVERGVAAGLAFNGDGKATGAMGVAVGDVDDDGRNDLFVTNFLGESNTLFLSSQPGQYEDRTRDFGLREPSLDVLGFGTQFVDADLDGRLELFVVNGHVDDLTRYGKPYRMRPQLLRLAGPRFEAVDAGPYFDREALGRSVARLDWNRDGREDLIVGDLRESSALLTNATSDAGRFLSLRLTGRASNRDALGTEVRVRAAGRVIVRQLTAGDGYLASNERRIVVGVGDVERLETLSVKWPSGLVQKFTDVALPAKSWLREGGTLRAESD